jgi:uncharacterized protein (UPF0333 family)
VPAASPSPNRAAAPAGGPPRRAGERGTVTLEALLIYPLVLLIAWIGMQLALVHLANRVALASAEEAASAARARTSTINAAQQRAHRYLDVLGGGLLADPTVRILRTADTVTVVVDGNAERIVPGFPVRVTQTLQSPTERFRPIAEPSR